MHIFAGTLFGKITLPLKNVIVGYPRLWQIGCKNFGTAGSLTAAAAASK
jgi:hypothetical protein